MNNIDLSLIFQCSSKVYSLLTRGKQVSNNNRCFRGDAGSDATWWLKWSSPSLCATAIYSGTLSTAAQLQMTIINFFLLPVNIFKMSFISVHP